MSAKWIRLETDFVDHPKVMRLAALLGSDEADAGWYVLRAWSWVSRFCPTGHVRDIDGTAMESACKWSGERGRLLEAMVSSGWFDTWDIDGTRAGVEAHDWDEHQGKVASRAAKERERKRAYRARKAAEAEADASRDNDGTADGTSAGRPAQRNVTGRDVTGRIKEEPESAKAPIQPPLELVGETQKKPRSRAAPDPKAEFERFAAALTPDEGLVFEAYESAMGVELGADWGLRKFVGQKLKAHTADELCAAIRGHASDAWRREKSVSLKAILRDASVIAAMAKIGRGGA